MTNIYVATKARPGEAADIRVDQGNLGFLLEKMDDIGIVRKPWKEFPNNRYGLMINADDIEKLVDSIQNGISKELQIISVLNHAKGTDNK